MGDILPDFILKEIERLTKTRKDMDEEICEEMFKYIDTHPTRPWNWKKLSLNANTTREYINEHPEKPWDKNNNERKRKWSFIEDVHISDMFVTHNEDCYPFCRNYDPMNGVSEFMFTMEKKDLIEQTMKSLID